MAIIQVPELCELLDAAISKHDLEKHRDELFAAVRPCTLLYQAPFDLKDSPIGTTRIGGTPDLPPSMCWPTHEGKKLPFIAQLNLSTLPDYNGNPLPPTGWLYFFTAANDDIPKPTSVLWYDGEENSLERQATPDEKDVLADWSREVVYSPVPIVKSKMSVSLATDDLLRSEKLTRRGELRLFKLLGALNPSDRYADRAAVAGQVLGLINFPDASAMDAVEYGDQEGDDWMLLLEIQSVGSMVWSDCGMLDFLIRRSRLDQRDFSNVYPEVYSS